MKVEEERHIFEHLDEGEYEQRQEKRRNDDFIVDDEGIGYRDDGGELWEFEEYQDTDNKKKQRKLTKVRKTLKLEFYHF